MATYWITKYALSGGIRSINAAEITTWGDGKQYITDPDDRWNSHRLGRDIFDNEGAARADAEARRQKKIASLRKQIAKLDALTF